MDDMEQAQCAQLKQADIYDQHRQAVIDFHKACKDFQVVQARKAEASARLDKVSRELAKALQEAVQDPTVPHELAPENPYPGAGQQQRGF